MSEHATSRVDCAKSTESSPQAFDCNRRRVAAHHSNDHARLFRHATRRTPISHCALAPDRVRGNYRWQTELHWVARSRPRAWDVLQIGTVQTIVLSDILH